jgi:hypothetical protein
VPRHTWRAAQAIEATEDRTKGLHVEWELPQGGVVQIFVRTLNKTITVGINGTRTTDDLRKRIGDRVNLSGHGLAFGGRHIEAGRLLTDYNIQNHSTLQQTCRRLLGGMEADLDETVIGRPLYRIDSFASSNTSCHADTNVSMRFLLLPCPPCCVQAWLLAAEKWEARATKLSARLEVEALDLNASLAKSDGLAVENRMRAALVDSCTKVNDPSSDVTLTKQCVNVSLARDGLTKVCLTLVLQACTLVHIMAVL